MDILIVPFGEVEHEVKELIKKKLNEAFGRGVSESGKEGLPDYAFDSMRDQYLSIRIINRLEEETDFKRFEKVLGIIDADLFVPGFRFIFGQAGKKAAVIALERLHERFWGLPENRALYLRRAAIEAVHELGHSYGLAHCENARCVMYFSNTIDDTDRKGADFCGECVRRLGN